MNSTHIKDLSEAYQEIYYNFDNFTSDISDICSEYFFESFEDSEYFVSQLIEQDLLEEFLFDFAEELEVDISYYLEENKVKLATTALRGVVNALSAAGRGKAGLTAAQALGKSGQAIKGAAASQTIRSARAAAKSTQPATAQPGRYLTALQGKRAARGLPAAGQTSAGTPKATAQRAASAGWERDRAAKATAQTALSQAATVAQGFLKSLKQGAAQQRLSTAAKGAKGTEVRIGQPAAVKGALPARSSALSPEGQQIKALTKSTGGGLIGSTQTPKLSARAPKPAWGSGQLTAAKPQSLSKPPQTPEVQKVNVKDVTKGGGLTNTVRATLSPAEKAGSMKYPGLEKYATGAKSSGGPSSTPKPPSPLKALAAGAATGAVGGAALNTKEPDKKQKDIKPNVYNTMDPSGKVRSRLKVGPKIVGTGSIAGDFDVAFKKARTSGAKEFDFRGKKYTTQLAQESIEDIILDYLLTDGYVTDERSAFVIMENMGEEWRSSVVENFEDLVLELYSIHETSLTRVMRKSEKGGMAILSGQRGDKSKKENKERSARTERRIRGAGLPGPTKVSGRYTENPGTPEEKKVGEKSHIVSSGKMGKKKFKKTVEKLGTERGLKHSRNAESKSSKDDQDSVLIQRKGGSGASLKGTSKTSWPGRGKNVKVGKMKPGRTGEFDTKVKNKTFTYEED